MQPPNVVGVRRQFDAPAKRRGFPRPLYLAALIVLTQGLVFVFHEAWIAELYLWVFVRNHLVGGP